MTWVKGDPRPQIDVLVPTWGRPARLAAMVQSVFMTTEREPPGGVQVWVRVSLEDPALEEYRALQAIEIRVHWHFLEGCTSYAKGIQALAERADGDIFFCGGDDTLFRTPGWDAQVEAAFSQVSDGLLVAYANNGLGREKCEHFFTTRRWMQAVGYLLRGEYEHFCCDQHVEEIASAVGRLLFLSQVTVEHMHRKYGKAPNDATYERVRGQTGTNARDLERFALLAGERKDVIARLKSVLAA